MRTYIKDPQAVLDYTFDWEDWLGTADSPIDTISTSNWSAPAGITIDSDSKTTTTTTVWLSGGTSGTKYSIENRIVTAAGREDDRHFYIIVANR